MIDNHNPNAALPTPLTKTNPKFRKTNKPLQMCPQLTRTTNARSPGRASQASLRLANLTVSVAAKPHYGVR